MAKRTVYTCDYCNKEADEDKVDSVDSMELWLHLNCSFIKKMSEVTQSTVICDNHMMGDFCSAKCLKLFIEKVSKKGSKK